MKSGFHRARTKPGSGGYVFDGKVVEEPQRQDDLVLRAEGPDCPPHCFVPAVEVARVRRVCLRRLPQLGDLAGGRGVASEAILADVYDDAVEPGVESAQVFESPPARPGLNGGIMDGVLSFCPAIEDRGRQPVGSVQTPLCQAFESVSSRRRLEKLLPRRPRTFDSVFYVRHMYQTIGVVVSFKERRLEPPASCRTRTQVGRDDSTHDCPALLSAVPASSRDPELLDPRRLRCGSFREVRQEPGVFRTRGGATETGDPDNAREVRQRN